MNFIPYPFPINKLEQAVGVLPIEKGGTGSDLTPPIANSLLLYNTVGNEVGFYTIGAGLLISGNTISAPTGGGGDLMSINNLSDLANTTTARSNLGLGSAAQQPSSAFVPSSAVSAFALTLLDDTSDTAFRTTLGLGTSATLNVNVANGVAPLDASGKLPLSVIPQSIQTKIENKGFWDAQNNSPAIPAASAANSGHFYISTSSCEIGHGYANVPNTDFRAGDWIMSDGTSWAKIDHTDAVTGVNGRTGNVTLTHTDIAGLGTAALLNTGAANGVAPLDASALISETYLPATVKDRIKFMGLWDALNNSPAIPAANSANKYHCYKVSESAQGGGLGHPNVPDLDYEEGDLLISNGSSWERFIIKTSLIRVVGLNTSLAAKVNAANPVTTGVFTHTGNSNTDTSFTQVANGRFLVTNNSTGRNSGYQAAVYSTRFDSANTNQVGVQIDVTHTTGNATTTNKFSPLQGLFGGSQKMSYGLDIVPSTTWTASSDVKAKILFYFGGTVSTGFGVDTGAGTRRYFWRSNGSNEYGVIIPDNTNYSVTVPSTQGGAGTVLTNDGAGNLTWASPSASVAGFTASDNTASPNNTVNASRLLVSGTSTNADYVAQPKGSGALLANLPDNAATGGNKRGSYALDLQLSRAGATQVGSGNYSVVFGQNNTASGTNAVAIGQGNLASQANSTALGASSTASGVNSVAIGAANTASGTGAVVLGTSCTASGAGAIAIGESCQASGTNAFATGTNGNAYIHNQVVFGANMNTNGDAQSSVVTLRNNTSNATPTNLVASSSGGGSNIAVPLGAAIHFVAKIVAKNNTSGEVATFMRDGVIKNIGGVTSLVGSIGTIGTDRSEGTMSGCSIAITADDTNERLQVAVTGLASTNIRWVCTLIYTERI